MLVALASGVSVGVILLAGVGPYGLLIPRVSVCVLGDRIGTFTIWTLETPLNKPPGVNVSMFTDDGEYNWTFQSGGLTMGNPHLSDGGGGWGDDTPTAGISSMGLQRNWTFFSVQNASQVGGVAGPCSQGYVAEASYSPVQGCGGFVTLPLANNASDQDEPHVWNGTPSSTFATGGCLETSPGAYYSFNASYNANASGVAAPVPWNLCGKPGEHPLEVITAAEVPIVVYVPYNGHEISATGHETWYSPDTDQPTANYTVPGGWVWMLAPVGPVLTPMNPLSGLPALAAFERLSCP